MHGTTAGTTPLVMTTSSFYYERETTATADADLWQEFNGGDTSRIADFSYAGYNYGQQDPPVASESDPNNWKVINVACVQNVCIEMQVGRCRRLNKTKTTFTWVCKVAEVLRSSHFHASHQIQILYFLSTQTDCRETLQAAIDVAFVSGPSIVKLPPGNFTLTRNPGSATVNSILIKVCGPPAQV